MEGRRSRRFRIEAAAGRLNFIGQEQPEEISGRYLRPAVRSRRSCSWFEGHAHLGPPFGALRSGRITGNEPEIQLRIMNLTKYIESLTVEGTWARSGQEKLAPP